MMEAFMSQILQMLAILCNSDVEKEFVNHDQI